MTWMGRLRTYWEQVLGRLAVVKEPSLRQAHLKAINQIRLLRAGGLWRGPCPVIFNLMYGTNLGRAERDKVNFEIGGPREGGRTH
jgi:hypothetical protein